MCRALLGSILCLMLGSVLAATSRADDTRTTTDKSSVLFEWAFLIGPLGAWPVQLWANHWRKRHQPVSGRGQVWLAILQLLAFAGFFGTAVLGLRGKY